VKGVSWNASGELLSIGSFDEVSYCVQCAAGDQYFNPQIVQELTATLPLLAFSAARQGA